LKSKIVSSPVIADGRVLVGSTDGRFYELKLETGEIVWETELQGGIIGSPAVGFGRVVIATDRGVVYCLGEQPSDRKKIP
jgi:outer membrane protein assembly factor BamB